MTRAHSRRGLRARSDARCPLAPLRLRPSAVQHAALSGHIRVVKFSFDPDVFPARVVRHAAHAHHVARSEEPRCCRGSRTWGTSQTSPNPSFTGGGVSARPSFRALTRHLSLSRPSNTSRGCTDTPFTAYVLHSHLRGVFWCLARPRGSPRFLQKFALTQFLF